MSPNKQAITFTFHSVGGGGGDQLEIKVRTNVIVVIIFVVIIVVVNVFTTCTRMHGPSGPLQKYPCATTLYWISGRARRAS